MTASFGEESAGLCREFRGAECVRGPVQGAEQRVTDRECEKVGGEGPTFWQGRRSKDRILGWGDGWGQEGGPR